MSYAQDTGRSLETIESFFESSVNIVSSVVGESGLSTRPVKIKTYEEDRLRQF